MGQKGVALQVSN